MKRVFRIAVLSIFGLALAPFAIPIQAADHGYCGEQDSRHAQYVRSDRGYTNRSYNNHYYDNHYHDRGLYLTVKITPAGQPQSSEAVSLPEH